MKSLLKPSLLRTTSTENPQASAFQRAINSIYDRPEFVDANLLFNQIFDCLSVIKMMTIIV
jgi:hypothetical protein